MTDPFIGMSREERAQRVARSYRTLVQQIAQGKCEDPAGDLHRLDMQWQSCGVAWHMPRNKPIDPDAWMSAAELAITLNRTRKDIYNWARLGHIEQRASADGAPEYSVASVLDYQRKLNQRRHASRIRKRPA